LRLHRGPHQSRHQTHCSLCPRLRLCHCLTRARGTSTRRPPLWPLWARLRVRVRQRRVEVGVGVRGGRLRRLAPPIPSLPPPLQN
jgi:hypothetical protein